ncbi:MAG TPA: phosphoglucomutase [Roseiflexaceae bacterium]|nr:phosphoglucomutase [Roseiflexaceae bacterium]
MADLNLGMFKAYDIRTPARHLPLDLAERLAYAEAQYFREQLGTNAVILCRDARLSGAQYLEQGIRVFRTLGFEVLANPQVSSTCQFYYTCMRHPEAAGIMYGASHNPGGDTGQKIVGPGLQPIAEGCGPDGGLQAIRRLYEQGARPARVPGGALHLYSYRDDFVQYSMELASVRPGDLAGLRVLQDFLSGAAGHEFIQAFTAAGAEVEARNLVPDGHFPSGAPNPVVREAIAPSLELLQTGGFDFAMFFDGDGDRLDFVAPGGAQLSPAFNLVALAPRLRAIFPGVARPQLYVDLKANPLAITRIARQGFGVHVIRNGHSQIKEALGRNAARGFLGAVEESSHYYLNVRQGGAVYPTENTLFYGLLTAKAWREEPALYAELLELQDTTFRAREWGYHFPSDALRARALAAVEEEFVRRGGQAMSRTADGMDMEATLLREGLPFVIDADTPLSEEWTQIAQRVSQSERGLARWEVTAGTLARKEAAERLIDETVRRFEAGPRYVG